MDQGFNKSTVDFQEPCHNFKTSVLQINSFNDFINDYRLLIYDKISRRG